MYRNVKTVGQVDNFNIYRNTKTGIAFVDDTEHGVIWSCHDYICSDGSVTMLKQQGRWVQKDRIERCNGYIFDIDKDAVSTNRYNFLMLNYCQCKACKARRKKFGR